MSILVSISWKNRKVTFNWNFTLDILVFGRYIFNMEVYNEIDFFKWVGQLLGNISLFGRQEGVIREILRTVPEITHADHSSLLILKENPEKISYDYSAQKEVFSTHKGLAKLATGVEGEVIRKRDIVITRDSAEINNPSEEIQSCKDKSMVAIPITLRGEVEAILYLYYLDKFPDDIERIKDLMKSLSPVFAFALANSRLYQRLDNTMRELRISYEMNRAMISSLDVNDLIEQIVKQITTHFGYEIIGVYLVDDDVEYATLEWTVDSIKSYRGTKIKIGEGGIIGRVVESGQPYYAADVSMVPFHGPQEFKKKSEFSIPLKIREKIIGVLDIESLRRDDFPKSVRNLLVALGAQIAVAIERSRLFEETKRLSTEDPLTGAINRRIVEDELTKHIEKAKLNDEEFAILFLDLDNFKEFNDKYGHQIGDEGLKSLVNTIKKSLQENDLLGRYGGDEFISILPNTDMQRAVRIAAQMLKSVRENELLKGLTLSIGIGVFPYDGKDLVELVRYADNACYLAKEKGGNRVEFATERETKEKEIF
jgi:diguanylate cyclase (GGDEF)-like protein